MKKLLLYIIVVNSLVLLSGLVSAQIQIPQGGTPRDFVLPAKKQSSLPNGMRITTVEYGNIPKVYVRLIIRTGAVHEAADQVWLSNLLALLMNQGTTSMNAITLAKKVAAMGGEITVTAGRDEFIINGSALSEYGADLVNTIADVVMHPALPASEIERLKADLKRELAVAKTRPQTIAQQKFFSIMYGNSAYGRLYPTDEMLSNYTLEDIKKFYNDNIGAKRSVLYVAGKFDEPAIAKAATEAFKNWKAGAGITYPSVLENAAASTTIIDRKNAPQTTVLMGLPVITPQNPDYLAFDITNSLLGGSFSSRITTNIREDKGYTYSPFSTISVHPKAAAWYERADITSEHTIDAINEIKKEITGLQNQQPSTEELSGIQRYAAGAFVLQNSSPEGIIQQLDFLDLYGLPESYLTNHVKNIYAVTPQQVNELAKKYLLVDKMVIVMVGDEAGIRKQQENIK